MCTYVCALFQGRLINVKHGARCVMVKVWGKEQNRGGSFKFMRTTSIYSSAKCCLTINLTSLSENAPKLPTNIYKIKINFSPDLAKGHAGREVIGDGEGK